MSTLNRNSKYYSDTDFSGISIITAVRNEEEGIQNFINEIHGIVLKYTDLKIQLILVEDGSTDRTIEKILEAPLNAFVKLVRVENGLGQGWAIGIGNLCVGKSSHIIMMDADGSHDPKCIHRIITDFKQGQDIVQGQKKINYNLQFRDHASSVFGKVSEIFFKIPFAKQNTIYRGVSSVLINQIEGESPSFWEFLRFTSNEWNNMTPSVFQFESDIRKHGKSKFNFIRLLKFAMNGISTTGNFSLLSFLYFSLILLAFGYSSIMASALIIFYGISLAFIQKKRKNDRRERMIWKIIYEGTETF